MGGMEFNDGQKMATDGNGLDVTAVRNGRKMSFKNDNIQFLSNFPEDSYIIYGNLSREQDSRF